MPHAVTQGRPVGDRRPPRLPLFANVHEADVAKIAALGEPVDAEPGAILMDQGDVGTECFFVIEGQAEVLVERTAHRRDRTRVDRGRDGPRRSQAPQRRRGRRVADAAARLQHRALQAAPRRDARLPRGDHEPARSPRRGEPRPQQPRAQSSSIAPSGATRARRPARSSVTSAFSRSASCVVPMARRPSSSRPTTMPVSGCRRGRAWRSRSRWRSRRRALRRARGVGARRPRPGARRAERGGGRLGAYTPKACLVM